MTENNEIKSNSIPIGINKLNINESPYMSFDKDAFIDEKLCTCLHEPGDIYHLVKNKVYCINCGNLISNFSDFGDTLILQKKRIMSNAQFETFFEIQIEKARKTLIKKAEEYATETARLHNFHKSANLKGESPERALYGMVVKHEVALSDFMDKSPEDISLEQWEEKLGDIINFMILLKALLWERGIYKEEL